MKNLIKNLVIAILFAGSALGPIVTARAKPPLPCAACSGLPGQSGDCLQVSIGATWCLLTGGECNEGGNCG